MAKNYKDLKKEIKNRNAKLSVMNGESSKADKKSSYQQLKDRVHAGEFGYDLTDDDVNRFFADSESFFGGAKKTYDTNASRYSKWSEGYSDFKTGSEQYRQDSDYIKAYLNSRERNNNSGLNGLNRLSYLDRLNENLSSGYAGLDAWYSKYTSEDDYNAAVERLRQEQQKAAEYDRLNNMDTALASRDIERMQGELDRLYERADMAYGQLTGGVYSAMLDTQGQNDLMVEYNSMLEEAKAIEEEIRSRKREVNQAENVQKMGKYDSYSQNADFEKYAQMGAEIKNPTLEEWNKSQTSILGWKPFDTEERQIKNKVAFGRDNYARLAENVDGSTDIEQEYALYNYMEEPEVATYNYILAKEGSESADEYLAALRETLNKRLGAQQAENIENIENGLLKGSATALYGAGAGLDQRVSGARQLRRADALPTSATQYGSSYVWENLGDDWAKLPETLGGSTLAQAAYDAITTSANMAPSVLLSFLVGSAGMPIAQGVARGVGSVALGASAAGNAYNQALKDGYGKEEARNYAALAGASESVLQNVLGGISKLGGIATNNVIQKAIGNIDNAILRIAVNSGISMAGEGFEEYLQEILDPAFKNLCFDENNEIRLFSADAAYSFLLGALTAGLLEGPVTIANEIGANKFGELVKESGKAEELISNALRLEENTDAYKMAHSIRERGKEPSNSRLGKLLEAYKKGNGSLAFLADTEGFEEARDVETAETETRSSVLERAAYEAVAEQKNAAAQTNGNRPQSTAANMETDIPGQPQTAVATEITAKNGQENAPITKTYAARHAETDESVNVSGVYDVSGGTVYAELDGGEVVPVQDLRFENKEMDQLFKAAENYSAKAANELLKMYDGSVPVEQYARAFNSVYRAAMNGLSYQQAVTGNEYAQNYLSSEGRQSAYAAAVADYTPKAGKGGVKMLTQTRLSAAQKNQLNTLDVVFKALNREVEVVDSIDEVDAEGKILRKSAANAYFDPKTNKYRIALDGIGEAYMYFAVHESIHDIRQNNAEGYEKLEKVVFDYLAENGEDVGELLKVQQQLYPDEGMEYWAEEIVANTVPAILRDPETGRLFAERFLEADEETRSAFERLLDSILEFLRKAYDALKGESSWRQMETIEKDIEAITEIREAYFDALEGLKSSETSGNVRYSLKYDNEGKSVVWIENSALTNKQLQSHKAVAEYIASHIGEVYTIIESGQSVYIGKDLPGEYTHSKYTTSLRYGGRNKLNAKNRAANELGELIETATNRRWEKTKHMHSKDAKYGMYRYDNTFAFPAKDSHGNIVNIKAFDVELLIRNASDGKKYLYDIVGIKENTPVAFDLQQREASTSADERQLTRGGASEGTNAWLTSTRLQLPVAVTKYSSKDTATNQRKSEVSRNAVPITKVSQNDTSVNNSIRAGEKTGAGKIRFSYKGKRAAQVDEELQQVADLALKGASKEQILRETGWFRGIDGMWRKEIDDSESVLHPEKIPGRLGEVLEHEKLYEHYPDLKEIPVRYAETEERIAGRYSFGFNEIHVDRKHPIDKAVLIHEVQHAIQEREGFAKGGDQIRGMIAFMNAWFDKVKETPQYKAAKTAEERDEVWLNATAGAMLDHNLEEEEFDDMMWASYRLLAGEIEARLSGERVELSQEERAANPQIPEKGIVVMDWEAELLKYRQHEKELGKIKSDLHYSKRDIDSYTERKYNKYGWAYVNDVVFEKEAEAFMRRMSDKQNGVWFPRTSDKKYVFAVGDHFGVNNVLIVSDGRYVEPSIERVYRINLGNETDIEIVRDFIYEREELEGARASRHVQQIFTEELVNTYARPGCPTYWEIRSERPYGEGRRSQENNRDHRLQQDGGRNAGEIEKTLKYSIKEGMSEAQRYEELKNTRPIVAEYNKGFSGVSGNRIGQLIQENSKLREALELARKQVKLTGKHTVQPKGIERLAKKILRQTGSGYKQQGLTEQLTKLFDYLANDPQPNWQKVESVGIGIAKEVLETSEKLDRTFATEYADAVDYLRNTGISLNDAQKAEAGYLAGSYNEYRKKLFGNVRLTNDGIPLDAAWQELAAMHPEIFDPQMPDTDMPAALQNVVALMKPQYVNPYGYELTGAAYDLFLQIYDAYFDIPEVRTFADKKAKEISLVRSEMRNKLDEVRKESKARYEERLRKLQKENTQRRQELSRRYNEAKAAQRAEDAAKFRKEYRALTDRKNEQIMKQKAMFADWVKEDRRKRQERESVKKYKDRIEANVKTMYNWLVKPTDQRYVPESLRNPVHDFIASIDFAGEKTTRRANQWRERLSNLNNYMQKVNEADLSGEAEVYLDIDEAFTSRLTAFIGETRDVAFVDELSVEQLKELDYLVGIVKRAIRDANTIIIDGKRTAIREYGDRFLEQAEKKGDSKRNDSNLLKLLVDNNMKPIYYFKELGGPFKELFEGVREGQNSYAFNMGKAKAFFDKTAAEHRFEEWANKKNDVLRFRTQRGQDIELTRQQALSLYATDKRETLNAEEGGTNHLRAGGFVYNDMRKQGRRKFKDAIPKPLTDSDIKKISAWLTNEQRAFADALVGYMSGELAAVGNATAMQQSGYKKFLEKYYFPFKTSSDFRTTEPGKAGQDQQRWKHRGFTKSVTRGANNPVVLQDFTEVWGNHVSEMLMYSAMSIPQENLVRVFNYRTRPTEESSGKSVKAALQNTYGEAAKQYMDVFLSDLNGEIVADPREAVLDRMVSKFKKGAVLASLSVAIQQPSAVGRSMALVDPKYFAVLPKKGSYEEAKKYSGIAIIKEMGGFDTGVAQGSSGWLTTVNPRKKMRKVMKFFIDGGYRDSAFGFMPQKMDEVTWGLIWEAVKKETEATTAFEPNSEAFFEAAGKRFNDVIDYTQVYDSLLSRSANMRSKSSALKVATSFMAEPTTALNMLYDAVRHAKDNPSDYVGKVKAGRAVGAFVFSAVMNAVLKSIVYAVRDDDEEQSYLEKYTEALFGSLIGQPLDIPGIGKYIYITGELSPVGMIPFAQDVLSIFQGYDIARADMSLFVDLKYALDNLDSEKKSTEEKITSLAGAIAAFLGLPLKNVIRDVKGVFNTAASMIGGGQETTRRGLWDAIRKGIGLKTDDTTEEMFKSLLKAQIEGDSNYSDLLYQRLENGTTDRKAKSENDIQSGIAKALSGEEKIAEAYSYRAEFRTAELKEVYRELQELGFEKNTITKAINYYEGSLDISEEEKEEEDIKEKDLSIYDYGDLVEAVEREDDAAVRDIVNALKKAGAEDSDIRSSVTSEYKDQYTELYGSGSTVQAKELGDKLKRYFGYEDEDLLRWVGRTKYSTLLESISQLDATEAIRQRDQLVKSGVEASTIKGRITQEMKPAYVDFMKSRQYEKANELKSLLIRLGYSEKTIEKWAE